MLIKILYFSIHAILSIRSLIASYFFKWANNLRTLMSIRKAPTFKNDSKTLKKLPLHIGILVVEDHVSLSDLANIIIWSVAMGVSFVSVYDKNGYCKRKMEDLKGNFEKQQISVQTSKSKNVGCVFHSGYDISIIEGSPPSTHVVLLERNDGCKRISSLARNLASAVSEKKVTINEISPCNIDTVLKSNSHFPDPDLVLRFGHTESMMGYLPWEIRLSEILSLPTHHGLDYKSFYKVLVSYGDTEQRFGK